jgi:predicted NBD/HSP70 family sugar kinase
MAGGRAIAQRAQLALKAGQRTELARCREDEVTARDVAEAAGRGDVVSQQLLADAGRHIGSAVASLVNLLNPGLVVLGGGVTGAGACFLEPLYQAVAERTMRPARQATRVVLGTLGRRSVAQGAAAMALQCTFQAYA